MSIRVDGAVHLMLLNDFISDILRDKGNDIYRMKGVLAVAGSPQKFVYQGVHMIFDGEFQGNWAPGEARCSKLVFIGKVRACDEARTHVFLGYSPTRFYRCRTSTRPSCKPLLPRAS